MTTVLHIDSSARTTGSATRAMTARTIAELGAARVIRRDLAAEPLPHLSEAWVSANFTPAETRTEAQAQTLALSDTLVAELDAADVIVIGLPVYNFGVPAALKAWIDLVARAGRTFRYTPDGPQGLLTGKRAIVAFASGGTGIGSEIDFASRYLTHMLGFLGITDVTFVHPQAAAA
ncbi:FMN-dependent NADH-azoreductase [Pseudaestuariivita atlantica]|uniref:FMN dependent NADH:quinone oxidoreductase n=1 Tax=Pseudaestuariivita atlantica TaxID=1317121 RepID=A0A0L1JRT2_9RHOB|nr:NAD(P)H-dependent oxidoreductase [Pseudaestuariivita atlantica]KNG94499.1 FMN-dependent NADH-azoreductase [Pseudaestuariivita atlantica]